MQTSPVYPQQGEVVIATVKKITQFGAFCALDEFNNVDAFLHVSEVSSGWVRSVRDHVKEGQKIVVLILRVDTLKRQIDISLKRISEGEKKRKMEAHNLDNRASKLLERVALKIAGGKKPSEINEVSAALKKQYGDLYTAFELASEGKEITGVDKPWLAAITEVAKQEIKPKFVVQRAVLKLKCYAENGLAQIKKTLTSLQLLSTATAKIQLHYVGAPVYLIDITSPDYKTCEKTIAKMEASLSTLPSDSFEWQLAKQEDVK